MIMTEAEIVRRYKGWPDKPKHAVQGLADLNACNKCEIVEILYRNGAINRASLAAYVRNGKCPDSLKALFNEDEGAKAQPDTKETRRMTDKEFRQWVKTASDDELKQASLEKRANGNYTTRANLAQAERNRRAGQITPTVTRSKAGAHIKQDHGYDGGWT